MFKYKHYYLLLVFGILVFILGSLFLPIFPSVRTYKVKYPVVKTVTKTRVLFEGTDLYISTWGYRYSGPYSLKAGQTITVTWEADREVNVYIMNEVDWNERFLDAPTSWRIADTGIQGSISYTLKHDETIYIQVMSPTWSAAKLYKWKETVTWQERIVVYEERIEKNVTYKSLFDVLSEK